MGLIQISGALACLSTGHLQAETLAIIGGRDNGFASPYAAIVSSTGVTTAVTGPAMPTGTGGIFSVAINSLGNGIVGGGVNNNAYVALVSSSGVATALTGPALPSVNGTIFSVAINSSGNGIIGGLNNNTPSPYAALVSSSGVTTALSGPANPTGVGEILSVAINASGNGIIGGTNNNNTSAYAALVSSSGFTTALTGSPPLPVSGIIYAVSINASGNGIIGGVNNTTTAAYAALVSSSGVITSLSGSSLPPASGQINDVAINSSGNGIIGGTNASNPYAALVSSSGVTTPLTGPAIPVGMGEILAVAINSSGNGIIGGIDNSNNVYAALVSSTGVTTALTGSTPIGIGEISDVAINSSGIGIIGGLDNNDTSPYAALVAPNGVLTKLSGGGFPSTTGFILAVAIADAVTPRSIGPYTSVMNMQLAATYALETHLIQQSRHWIKRKSQNEETALLASLSDSRVSWGMWPKRKKDTAPPTPDREMQQQAPNFSLWAAPFGDYVHQKGKNGIPTFKNDIAGILVGFDYRMTNGLAGLGLGYAFNYAHYGQSLGHGKINEEMASAYGLYSWSHCWINAVLWGGIYQLYNERHTLIPMAPVITSTAHTRGWVFSPHLEAAAPFELNDMNWLTIEPFLMFDWVNNWQNSFTERGSSGFNLVMKDHYASLLRSEAGLRFYELLYYDWGRLLFEEKASYVNQAPFHFNETTTFFVSSASTFPIGIGSTQIQNLGGVEFRAAFMPWDQDMPYGVLSFRGEFGSSYQSYFANLEIGKNF